MLTVIILTRDEALHIERAISSIKSIADRIIVVDSGSVDNTVSIAERLGAKVLVHPFVNQAKQFNWALQQLPKDTDWVFRLDADEIVSDELKQSLSETLPNLGAEVAGASVLRRMTFMQRPIRWGGVFPIRITRVLKYGRGLSEDRWMDEHIVLKGAEVKLYGELIDDNLNSLSWWIKKHNEYASREAIEMLNAEQNFLEHSPNDTPSGQPGVKRWLKEKVYTRLPIGIRAFLYFLYRYLVRLGFLDGKEGIAFHLLQGFWYRYLVDMKIHEVKVYMTKHNMDAVSAIHDVFDIDLSTNHKH